MTLKSLSMVAIAAIFLPLTSSASSKTKITLTGKKAEILAQALVRSGFDGTIKADGTRVMKIDRLVMVTGIAQHECDDETLQCGFDLSSGIQTAEQNGQTPNTSETIQLTEALAQTLDPVFNAKKVQYQDGGMGRAYSDYGSILCTWKVNEGGGFYVKNVVCTVDTSSIGQ